MKKSEILDEMELLDQWGLEGSLSNNAVIIALLKLIVKILADAFGEK